PCTPGPSSRPSKDGGGFTTSPTAGRPCSTSTSTCTATGRPQSRARRLGGCLTPCWSGASARPWWSGPPRSGASTAYSKVDLQGEEYQKANLLFDRLEHALQRFLAFYKNLADFEIKGKVGFLRDTEYAWKQYGKLPIHDGWNYRKLAEFKSRRTIPLASL